MTTTGSVVAVFTTHRAAETAVRRLAAAGFEMKDLSVVGKGYHAEETVVRFYGTGKRGAFSGVRGTFWSDLWSLFLGGAFFTNPLLGHVVILGYLATIAIPVLETAVTIEGLSEVGVVLYRIGIPREKVQDYEAALKSDGFLVMAHGTPATMISAKMLLDKLVPTSLGVHAGGQQTGQIIQFG